MAHACNPSTLGGRGGWITQGQEFKTTQAKMAKPVSTKNTTISLMWWQVPVIAATPGTLRHEDHLNPQGESCSELKSCHCTPTRGIEKDCLKKQQQQKQKTKKEKNLIYIHFSIEYILKM